MSAGLQENELSNSNGLSSNNKGEMNTSEEKGDSIEDAGDFSLFEALEMEPYLFEHIAAIDQSGQKVPWKRTKERRFEDWLTLSDMRTNRRAFFSATALIYN